MKRHLAITSIIVLIIAVGFTAWYSRSNNPVTVSQLNLIKTSFPQRKDFNVVAHFFGKTQAKNKVIITALKAGTILSVDAVDETVVKKGMLVFTLGGARVSASAAATRQKIESLKQQIDLAKTTVSRKQLAVEQKIASFDELDKAKTVLAALNTQLEEAAGQFDILEDAIHVKAPISGIFTSRGVNKGQNIEKGEALAEIIDSNDLRVMATLFPPEDAQLQGRTAAIHTASGKTLSGVVTGVLPQRTSAGGTTVWIESDNINRKLKTGEIISGDIQLATHKKTLAIPEKAVVRDKQEKTYVFVRQAESYTKQKVQTGPSSDGWVEILSGLIETDEVVTEGAYELFYRDFNKVYKVAD